jgi:16S rRNA G966 N2-methylase RsmD
MHTLFPGIYLRRNIPVTNYKKFRPTDENVPTEHFNEINQLINSMD